MVEIRPIHNHEVLAAKHVIFKVAFEIFKGADTLEESIAKYSAQGKLSEMDDVQRNYFNNGGTFLVSVEDGRIIGTGAIRYLEGNVCELKRMWLLTEYHGQGHGYRMMQELFSVAREKGYKQMRLETDKFVQTRAIAFYERLGFHEIPAYDGDDPEDMAMEIFL